MYKLETTVKFDAAHKLPWHEGKCKNLHGHTWKVKIEIWHQLLNKKGIVADFGDIKGIINKLDHKYLNEEKGLENPTAENLARIIYETMFTLFEEKEDPSKVKVTVWETETNSISFTGEE